MPYAVDVPRYDYLEFTDSRGGKVRYDMKVGTEKWPKVRKEKPLSCLHRKHYFLISSHIFCFSLLLQKVTFDAGPQLQFLFHSDSSNNEWGYKFTVTALGLPDITISWMSDLQLLVARLMGRLASRTLALKSPHGETFYQNASQKTKDGDLKCVSVWLCWAKLRIFSKFEHFRLV